MASLSTTMPCHGDIPNELINCILSYLPYEIRYYIHHTMGINYCFAESEDVYYSHIIHDIKIVQFYMERELIENTFNLFCFACETGNTELVHYLESMSFSCLYLDDTEEKSQEYNHIESEYIEEDGSDSYCDPCYYAAKSGNLKLLQELSTRYPFTISALLGAFNGKHEHIVEYLWPLATKGELKWNHSIFGGACEYGDTEILDYMYEHRRSIIDKTVYRGQGIESFEVVKWIIDHNISFDLVSHELANTTNYKGIGYALKKGVLKIGTSLDNDVFSEKNGIGQKGLEHTKLFIELVNSYYGKEIYGLKNVSVIIPMRYGHLDLVEAILEAGGTFTDKIFSECMRKAIFHRGGIQHSEKEFLHFIKNVMFGKYAKQYINTKDTFSMVCLFEEGFIEIICYLLENKHVLISTFQQASVYNENIRNHERIRPYLDQES